MADEKQPETPGFATLCIHGKKHLDKHEGRPADPRREHPHLPEFDLRVRECRARRGHLPRRGRQLRLRARLGNPTQTALETEVAYLEQGEAALALASGMAAATSPMLNCCRCGDHIVAGDTLYGGTHQLFTQTLPRMGIEVTEVPATDPANFARAITKNEARLPGNAGQSDARAHGHRSGGRDRPCARGAGAGGQHVLHAVPAEPAPVGADIVLHSATKYIGGHGDTVAGILVGKADWILRAHGDSA